MLMEPSAPALEAMLSAPQTFTVPPSLIVSVPLPLFPTWRSSSQKNVEPVPVTSGQGVGEWVAVEGPISAGERVVTRGNERIFPGAPVAGEPLEYTLP